MMTKVLPLVFVFAFGNALATPTQNKEIGNATMLGCTWTHGESCYTMVESKENFYAASTNCGVLHGGYLAAVNTEDEDMFLRIKLFDRYGAEGRDHIWIGLIMGDGNIWQWSNGDPLTYTGWGPNSPSGDGAQGEYGLDTQAGFLWEWNDIPADHANWYICES